MERMAFRGESNGEVSEPRRGSRPSSRHSTVAAGVDNFQGLFLRKAAKRTRKQLKVILSAAGVPRDCDIAAKILSKSARPGAAQFRHVHAQRRNAEKSLLVTLKRVSLRTREVARRAESGLSTRRFCSETGAEYGRELLALTDSTFLRGRRGRGCPRL
jgi:hypothetical protein